MRNSTSILGLLLGLGILTAGPIFTNFDPFGPSQAYAKGSDSSGSGSDSDNSGPSDNSGHGGHDNDHDDHDDDDDDNDNDEGETDDSGCDGPDDVGKAGCPK